MIYLKNIFFILMFGLIMNCFSQTESYVNFDIGEQDEEELLKTLNNLQDEPFDSIFNSLFSTTSIRPKSMKVLGKEITRNKEFVSEFFKVKKKRLKETSHSNPEYVNELIEKKDIPFQYEISSRFPVFELSFPIDWRANPNRNNTWELYLLNFDWMDKWYKKNNAIDLTEEEEDDRILLAMHAIFDYYNQEFTYPSEIKFAWYDHAISRRLERVIKCTEAYINAFETLDVNLLDAAANIIISHTYALASSNFYPRIPHNHGFMMDNALLLSASTLPFKERAELITISMVRIRLQLLKSVTKKGIHMEHSPGYQTFYVFLINDVIENLIKLDLEIPDYLLETQSELIASCAYFIQPNLTHIQFGDTKGGTKPIEDFTVQFNRFKTLTNDSLEFKELEYVLSKGKEGTKPEITDIVYDDGGYAIFRDNWYDESNFDDQIMAAFKANNFSWTHYHRDDTTFSIYAFGREVIVDAGHYNFNRKDSLTFYQYSAFGHNVLVLDNENFRPSKKNFGKSKITEYQINDSISWVKATHPHYRGFGIKNQERTFIFKKPNKFLVRDELDANKEHQYKQLIHFHPDYTDFEQLDKNSCIIRTTNPKDPEVIVKSNDDFEFKVTRGILNENEIQGWYFPDANIVQDCIALEVIFKDKSTGRRTFETEIEIIKPINDN